MIREGKEEELDKEWIQLILEAKELGINKEQIRMFLKNDTKELLTKNC